MTNKKIYIILNRANPLKATRGFRGINFSSLLIILFLSCFQQLHAQDLEAIGKEKPLKVTGGLAANGVFFATTDSVSSRDPYTFYMSGNLNFNLYGWNVPFTFSYTNQKTSYTQPFNQYCIHPKYKWVTAHIGYTSTTFSSYTVNGHLFLGAQLDLSPEGPVKVSAMGGRLLQAIAYDSTDSDTDPEYERWGYGIKTDVKIDKIEFAKIDLSFIGFYAKDNPNSLSYVPDSIITPAENIVLSSIANIKLLKSIGIRAEFASSGMTNNTQSEIGLGNNNHLYSRFGGIFTSNNTSEFYNAIKLNSNYQAKIYTIGLGYERIAPNYQTLGAYYFSNDLENITVNGSLKLFESKVNISGNVGLQHDDLDNSNVSEMKRWVSALNIGYSSGKKLNASFSYSNFTSYTNIKSQFDYITATTDYDNLDTLDYTQISNSTSLNVNYNISNTESKRQSLNVNLSYQEASEIQADVEENSGSKFYNLSSSYSHGLVPINLTWVLAFNASLTNTSETTSSTFGPTLSVNKLFFDKVLRTTFSSSYINAFTDGEPVSTIISLRANASARIKKHHNINASLVVMNKDITTSSTDKQYTEFTATIGYTVNF